MAQRTLIWANQQQYRSESMWRFLAHPISQGWASRMYSYTNREKPPRPNRFSFYLYNLDGGLSEGSYFQEAVGTIPGARLESCASPG